MLFRKDDVFYIDLPKKIQKEEKQIKEKKEENFQEMEKLKEQVISQAKEEAKRIIEEAKKKADSILRSASNEAARMRNEAEKLLQKVKEQKQEFQNYILTLKKRIEDQLSQEIEKAFPEILGVLRILFRKILEKEMDEDTVKRKLKSVLSRVAGIEDVKIRLNPEDVKRLDSEELKSAKLIPDPNVEKGGVVVETEFGILDKTFSYQWKLVEDIFEEVVGFEERIERVEKKTK
ncbi:FliH/SctL family protein [Thermotoga sp. KOL6]|uniref:FliH/SctL family protein n=1 Tax=Thermotoga sp. KOL6 TaxID=126741 RepID=UPI000C769E10|nr:FliH/SctL family protein [Thermotoga sp. KOL6]PLV58975.1 flagellar export protein FliJ [Thermotoga sp. KOL6]